MISNSLRCGDCLQELLHLEDNSIDLTVTSPPYNVNLGQNNHNSRGYDSIVDNRPHEQYIAWLHKVFLLIYKKTRNGGRCAINIGNAKNGAITTATDIAYIMQHTIGWLPMTTIVWHKTQVNNRTAWGSFQSPSAPSFPTPFEYIFVFAKNSRKLQYKGETDLHKEEFVKWSLSMWTFPGESQKQWHPAPFPEQLPERLIKMLTWRHALVADPFAGTGTTLRVAQRLDRRYWDCDISKEYVKRARVLLQQPYQQKLL